MHKNIFKNHRFIFFGAETQSASPEVPEVTTIASLPTNQTARDDLTKSQEGLTNSRDFSPEGKTEYENILALRTLPKNTQEQAVVAMEKGITEAMKRGKTTISEKLKTALGNIENSRPNLANTTSETSIRYENGNSKFGGQLTMQPGNQELDSPITAFKFDVEHKGTKVTLDLNPQTNGKGLKGSKQFGSFSGEAGATLTPDGPTVTQAKLGVQKKGFGTNLGLTHTENGPTVIAQQLQINHLKMGATFNLENFDPETIQTVGLTNVSNLNATITLPVRQYKQLGPQQVSININPNTGDALATLTSNVDLNPATRLTTGIDLSTNVLQPNQPISYAFQIGYSRSF